MGSSAPVFIVLALGLLLRIHGRRRAEATAAWRGSPGARHLRRKQTAGQAAHGTHSLVRSPPGVTRARARRRRSLPAHRAGHAAGRAARPGLRQGRERRPRGASASLRGKRPRRLAAPARAPLPAGARPPLGFRRGSRTPVREADATTRCDTRRDAARSAVCSPRARPRASVLPSLRRRASPPPDFLSTSSSSVPPRRAAAAAAALRALAPAQSSSLPSARPGFLTRQPRGAR